MEILSSYLKQISVGDMLTVEALITNPLDWHHFYEKISLIKKGEKTDFTIVTNEGERLSGSGDITEVDKWSNYGHYGFKIKIDIKKQKSLTDKRVREESAGAATAPEIKQNIKDKISKVDYPAREAPEPLAVSASIMTKKDMKNFSELLKNSVSMDIAQ